MNLQVINPMLDTTQQVDDLLDGKSDTTHTHTVSDITDISTTYVPITKLGGSTEGNIPLLGEDGTILGQFIGEKYNDVRVGFFQYEDPQASPLVPIAFYRDELLTELVDPIIGVIYVDSTTNNAYRYDVSITSFIGIQPAPVSLGTTTGTAYPGNLGQDNRDDIDNILSGDAIVGKSTADANGNTINTTYATKTELTDEADRITDLEIVSELFVVSTVSGADFKVDTNFQPLANQYIHIKFDNNTSENGARVSFDDGANYFNIEVQGAVLTGSEVSERTLTFYRIGTSIDLEIHENDYQTLLNQERFNNLIPSDVQLGSVMNYGLADQADAEAGTSHEKYMTPLRTAQAITELGYQPTYATLAEIETGTDTTKVINPEILNDALATKAEVDVYTFTILTTDWSGTDPVQATTTVTGLLATDTPVLDIDLSSVLFADIQTVQAEFGKIYLGESFDNSIVLSATSAPTEDLNFVIKVVR